MKTDGDGASSDPDGKHIAEPPYHVVPAVRRRDERQVSQVRSLVAKEAVEKRFVDLDRGTRIAGHRTNMSPAGPRSPRQGRLCNPTDRRLGRANNTISTWLVFMLSVNQLSCFR